MRSPLDGGALGSQEEQAGAAAFSALSSDLLALLPFDDTKAPLSGEVILLSSPHCMTQPLPPTVAIYTCTHAK